MAIIYDPSKELEKIAPKAKVERMMRKNLSLKRAALGFVNDIKFLDKGKIAEVALKTVNGYKERAEGDKDERALINNDPKQLVQRVQNEVLFQIKNEIKSQYKGEMYEWLPSDAEEPDPLHQLNYGKVFEVGVGEMPGDRWGCRCGMRILTDEDKLEL